MAEGDCSVYYQNIPSLLLSSGIYLYTLFVQPCRADRNVDTHKTALNAPTVSTALAGAGTSSAQAHRTTASLIWGCWPRKRTRWKAGAARNEFSQHCQHCSLCPWPPLVLGLQCSNTFPDVTIVSSDGMGIGSGGSSAEHDGDAGCSIIDGDVCLSRV